MSKNQRALSQQRLRELRELSEKTQEKIAKELHIGRSTLSNYETGKRCPPLEMLHDIADYYKVDIGYLLAPDDANEKLDETTKRKLINFKYLIKERYLDLDGLSTISKIELVDYYLFLKRKEMGQIR